MAPKTTRWLLILSVCCCAAFAQAQAPSGSATAPSVPATSAVPAALPEAPPPLTAVPLPATLAQRVLQPRDTVRLICWGTQEVWLNTALAVGSDGRLRPPGLAAIRATGLKLGDLQAQLLDGYAPKYPGGTLLVTLEGLAPAEQPAMPAAAPPALDEPLVAGAQLAVRCWSGDADLLNVTTTVARDLTIALPPLGKVSVANLTLQSLRDLLQFRYRAFYPRSSLSLLRVADGQIVSAPTTTVEPTDTDQAFPPAVSAAEILKALPRFGASVFAIEGRMDANLTPGAPVSNAPVPANYQLGPGDRLSARCWTGAVEHYSHELTVSPEGRIYIALLGELTVAEQTLAQVAEQITARSQKLFRNAQTTLVLAQVSALEVYVTGDALAPGKYTLPGTASVFTALYAAGGPSAVGSLRSVRLVRQGAPPREIDLYPYLLTGDRQGDEPLKTGDTVFVGPLGKALGVSGLVRRPALYEARDELTCAQALEMAGGLDPRGYGRNVEVWRVDQNTAWNVINVDLSRPAADPQGAGLKLQAGDLVLVRPVLDKPANTVVIVGAVRRPGTYQVDAAGLDVRGLLQKAEGLEDTAYTRAAVLWRLNATNEYEQMRFDLLRAQQGDKSDNLSLVAGDKVFILARDEVLQPREVSVQGAVANPAIFPWVGNMRLSDLLLRARGLLDGAHTERADLRRLTPTMEREIIPVSLTRLLSGDPEADLELRHGDQLIVYRQSEVAVAAEVIVSGAVQRPGTYPRAAGMKASDLIVQAGGLVPDAAHEIEHVRGRASGEPRVAKLKVTSQDGMDVALDPDPVLTDDDALNVSGTGNFKAKAPVVFVQGMVARPGAYALLTTPQQPDTIYALLTRAGDLLPNANFRGIILYRPKVNLLDPNQRDEIANVLQSFNRERGDGKTVVSHDRQTAALSANVTAQLTQAFTENGGSTIVIPPRPLSTEAWAQAVPVDGAKLIETKGVEGDMPLTGGDIVVVPETPTTVAIIGAVVRPGAVKYAGPKTAEDYVKMAGGPTQDAVVARLVAIRANGSVSPATDTKQVFPGDVIVVPSDYLLRQVSHEGTGQRILRALTILGAALILR